MKKVRIYIEMNKEQNNSQTTDPAIAVDTVLGTVHFKQVTYRIVIQKLSSQVPTEFHEDFIEWLKSKSLQLGLGRHCENYYDHDETGDSDIEVLFSVHCA